MTVNTLFIIVGVCWTLDRVIWTLPNVSILILKLDLTELKIVNDSTESDKALHAYRHLQSSRTCHDSCSAV